jgi:hypothetical protein
LIFGKTVDHGVSIEGNEHYQCVVFILADMVLDDSVVVAVGSIIPGLAHFYLLFERLLTTMLLIVGDVTSEPDLL